MSFPLKGFRVLDLTNVLSGPFCCHQLAHFGAEVIKVENPKGGDLARQLGADPELVKRGMGISYLAQNAGKRSVTIDFKHPEGKEIFRTLVKSAHVVVENFRPGVMDRLGIGYKDLLEVNPRLVYCAITGFGQDGPLAARPAYDQIIQGMSGVMSITGAPDTAPYRVGYPVADTVGGLTAAFAVAAALAQPDRTGGTYLDVSMLASTMVSMGWAMSNMLIAKKEPAPMGNENITASPSGAFKTGSGLLNISANKQEQFEALCRTVGRPDLYTDERFHERHARLKNRYELRDELEQALAARGADEWCDLLNDVDVPSGPVYLVSQALAQPQIAERGMVGEFRNVPGVDRDLHLVRTGVKIDGNDPSVDFPPRTLGADTVDILHELGLDDDRIERLRTAKAI
ncbi:CoA transferase [Paraburkholderia sp. Ac-20336]|uniref:CaiB/BaiF CoA transferase family protein n=1 Tax=Burkholderiaceae TaxID=119060 RepID=UPI001421785C|nr:MULTISPECIES: CaiB/BaiF CoA-transferase family protein [Burkholderiaceae]MBN3804760.1 CoA transferase [Paraburkholderia sp. Ac-20336]MBN3847798.1 CoA transferase [Paraburkholderia sp. Ac-20342]NIF53267.1 CoA transferase [Burkholderia sp. Ax-1724]NIF76831.1 CoA transferase [Paraburkholderia sp. Cy-641]